MEFPSARATTIHTTGARRLGGSSFRASVVVRGSGIRSADPDEDPDYFADWRDTEKPVHLIDAEEHITTFTALG